MYDIDLNRYTEVVDSAIALRPQIEKAVDEICAQGYSNLFFIGCGGTYAHSLPMMYWLESTTNKVEAHAVIAAEFMVMGHKAFSKDSVCIFSTRSGNTKEIVAAAKFCKEAGARTMVYVSNDNTPVCEYADYKFYSPAEDPDLCEAIYSYTICLLGRFMKNAGAFDKYDEFMAQYAGLTKYLIAGKEKFDPFCQELAKKFKDVDYHMVIGGGMLWGEAYDYAMCILEEMQWIRTKSIHVCEYFHGTLELLEDDVCTTLLLTEGPTRAQDERVKEFAARHTKKLTCFDTKEYALPGISDEFRPLLSPVVMAAVLQRISKNIEVITDHSLDIRRYYRKESY